MPLPANFPTSLDALANPTATTNRDDPGFYLDEVIARIHDILEALEAKVGIGASAPGATAAVLRRTAPGASLWGPVAAGDMDPAGNTSKVLSAGSGGAVGWNQVSAPMLLDGATWKEIATLSGTGSSGVLEFTGFPSTLRELRILLRGGVTGTGGFITCGVNFETTPTAANYYFERLYGLGASPGAQESLAGAGGAFVTLGAFPSAANAGYDGVAEVLLPNYASGQVKAVLVRGMGLGTNPAATGNLIAETSAGFFISAAAITRIRLFVSTGASWSTTTRATLLGA